jgi:hypothetical protein
LNALLERAGGGETPVDELSDDELYAELERRKARRAREAEERLRREQAEREARARAEARARVEAQARGTARGSDTARASRTAPGSRARTAPKGGARPTSGAQAPRSGARDAAGKAGARPRARAAAEGPSAERRLRELYRLLETPYGADFDTVKASFRRLMRKYHPDLHTGNPTKHKAATELTMSLTLAYDELERHLKRR